METLVFSLNVGAAWFMTGLIWFVQVVHYPLFDRVDPGGFARFEQAHASRTSYVVIPPMLIELSTAALLIWMRPAFLPGWLAWAGLAAALGIWASTFGLQVPCHQRLGQGYDAATHCRLVRTNWLRTVLWSTRAVGIPLGCWASGGFPLP